MILKNELLKYHTTFKIGGPAKFFSEPKTLRDIIYIVKLCNERGYKIFPITNGSDILFSDEGFDGMVIKLDGIRGISVSDDIVEVYTGESLPKLAVYLEKWGLSGFEYLYGVPGKVGGAVAKNAGAYNMEIKDIFLYADIVSWNGELMRLYKNDLNFRYRESDLLKYGIVYRAYFKLRKDESSKIKMRRIELSNRRKETQPYGVMTAGCMFKNPDGYSAGKLIENVGLKGFKVGDVKISEKHANFFINLGNGTASDVLKLMETAKKRVYETYGILLEEEVVIVK